MEIVFSFIILIGLLLLLYLFGIPVAISMGISAITFMISPWGRGLEIASIATRLAFSLNSFAMLAIPFYLLLGRLMNNIGITTDIFEFADAAVGHITGGIAHVNVIASMIFSGMSGLAVADAAGLGRIEYKSMVDRGYPSSMALGVTGSSTIIGPIIPPSVIIIIYAVISGESIGDLFLAGIVPGLLIGALLMIQIVIMIKIFHIGGRKTTFDVNNLLTSFVRAAPAIAIPIFIIGGLVSGVFTATEAGAIAVIYTLLLSVINGVNKNTIYYELRDGAVETFSLTFIIANAAIYGLAILQAGIPVLLANALADITNNSISILFILVILLLIIGTFMDTAAAVTVLTPVFIPIIDVIGINPIQFGIVMILTLTLGILTPPFGIVLFVLEKVTDAELVEIMRAVIPYYLPIILTIVLIILFPELTTYIPENM